jgi:hypothetical protein
VRSPPPLAACPLQIAGFGESWQGVYDLLTADGFPVSATQLWV